MGSGCINRYYPGVAPFIRTALFCLLLLCSLPALAQKIDTVILKNGNNITCEIKDLTFGKLRCSTEHLGTVYIEWIGVRSLESTRTFEVELTSGEKHYGSLQPGPEGPGLMVMGRHEVGPLKLRRVVNITPMKDRILDRLDGGIDAGLNFTSASQTTEFSLDANIEYTGKKFRLYGSANSLMKEDEDESRVRRVEFMGGYGYFLRNRWEFFGMAKFQKNEELGLKHRFLGGAGLGRYLIHTHKNFLLVMGGLAVNRERYYNRPGTEHHLEGVLGFSFRRFIFGDFENEITSILIFYPNLSEGGRYRIDFDTSFRHKFSNDFYIKLSLYENFNSHPPTSNYSKNDYGFVSSIGFTF